MKCLSRLILSFLFLLPPSLVKAQSMDIAVSSHFLEIQADQYYYYSFGRVQLNSSRWVDILLHNRGPGPLILRGVFIAGPGYWAFSDCPPYLGPGQMCRTQVEFRPLYEGAFDGRLRFAFPEDSIHVDFYGWGSFWP